MTAETLEFLLRALIVKLFIKHVQISERLVVIGRQNTKTHIARLEVSNAPIGVSVAAAAHASGRAVASHKITSSSRARPRDAYRRITLRKKLNLLT